MLNLGTPWSGKRTTGNSLFLFLLRSQPRGGTGVFAGITLIGRLGAGNMPGDTVRPFLLRVCQSMSMGKVEVRSGAPGVLLDSLNHLFSAWFYLVVSHPHPSHHLWADACLLLTDVSSQTSALGLLLPVCGKCQRWGDGQNHAEHLWAFSAILTVFHRIASHLRMYQLDVNGTGW